MRLVLRPFPYKYLNMERIDLHRIPLKTSSRALCLKYCIGAVQGAISSQTVPSSFPQAYYNQSDPLG